MLSSPFSLVISHKWIMNARIIWPFLLQPGLTFAFQQVIICYICSNCLLIHIMYASITCDFIWIITVFVIIVILTFLSLMACIFPRLWQSYAANVLVWLFACHVPFSYIKLLSADNLCFTLPPVKLSFSVKSNKLTHFQLVNLTLVVLS